MTEAPTAPLVVRRALISVSDKTGVVALAAGLRDLDIEIVSTGSTARTIRDAGHDVVEVAEITGFPEILDGRVKTLHPGVHAGILADRSRASHMRTLEELGIGPIDLVVVNLYPFAQAVARPDVSHAEAIEQIDIGGPTLVRAAAKNHAHVGVVVEPSSYDDVLGRLRGGGLDAHTRRRLAVRAFGHTAAYDAQIARWFDSDRLGLAYGKIADLRYGENAHQSASWYHDGTGTGISSARQLGGKPLSYNNVVDVDAAWGMAREFTEPCVAIVKHTNPAGLAVAATLAEAYPCALAGDPVSAFGGIVACNRPVDDVTARQIVEVFTEVVVAPAFTDGALEVLAAKPNLRVLAVDHPSPVGGKALRGVDGGLLVQDQDDLPEAPESWEVPTRAKPDEATLTELAFAWRVCKHVKSNAIVLTRRHATVGVGAGQMSRVDSVRLAVTKADGRAHGAVLASDAFFPFRDGPDVALEAGVVAVIQPGGSKRDEDTIAACDEHGVPMVVTGRRHFRH